MSETIKISKIQMNNGQIEGLPKNPRLIRDEKFAKLKKSIQDFPEMLELREVVVFPFENKFVCIGGNMRYLACKDLGLKEIPAKVLPADFPPEKLAEFAMKDNASFGENDWDLIANEWSDFPLEDWGLDLPDFEAVDEEETRDAEPQIDKAEELNKKWKVKSGDLFAVGKHFLLCGDSTKRHDIEQLMQGEKAQMVFTDPPYGYEYQSNMRTKSAKFEVLQNDDVILDGFIPHAAEFSEGWILICTSWKVLHEWLSATFQLGDLQNLIVWDKGGGGIGDLKHSLSTDYELILAYNRGAEIYGKRIGSVWDIGKDSASEYLHATQKPIQLPMLAFDCFAPKGCAVLDFFGGSGSTMVAAENKGRRAFLCEISPNYCAVILERMSNAFEGISINRIEQTKEANG